MRLLVLLFLATSACHAQDVVFLFSENFDAAVPPALPAGWTASTNRSTAGDFVCTTSSARSAPNALLSSNATISQTLTSPLIDFSSVEPERLEFACSRSGTHAAGLLVEASLDDGLTFSFQLSDTLRNTGISGYSIISLPLPESLGHQSSVRFRWRLIGNPTGGSSGTFRIDDIAVVRDIIIPETAPQTVVINEIMFDPLTGQNEWIELFHRGSQAVDLRKWSFSDRSTASGANIFTITASSALLHPGEFAVIAADSSIFSRFPSLQQRTPSTILVILNRSGGFSLNNDGDDVILRDALGKTIDSVSYASAWHHPDVTETKGRSVERINPSIDSNDRRNWSTSPAPLGGTPGTVNAIFTTILPSQASLSINPNPFSPDGDGYEDFCIIRYKIPLATSLIRVSLFDRRGRLLRTLVNSGLSGVEGEVVWDGLDDGGQRVRIGPYIVFIEAIDGEGGKLATAKGVVVVATKL